MNLDTIDPTFVDDLQASAAAVHAVARFLLSTGHPVMMRPTFVRPTADEREDYSDDGDLTILRTVEVKHRRTLSFASRDAYPFPTAIVDPVVKFDKKRPRPSLYVIVNKEMRGALLVDVRRSFDYWLRQNILAGGRVQPHYVCPIEFTKYRNL